MLRIAIATGLLGLAFTGQIHAASTNPMIDAGKPLAPQIDRIQTELADNKTYSELKQADRAQVVDALSRIRGKLGDDGVLPPLDTAAQAEVASDQTLVNTILAKAKADSRLICRRETAIGSNRAQTVCMTVAERAAMREQTMDVMRKTGISQPENRP
ncbi:MAG: hypothetical protein J0I01_06195 [Stenotrophomonas nitritireducens]|uniref:hypothetical protein n=1 Tax=Stenotrophomonas nitritireducens TaxID=83617 RepID=UPI001AC7E8B1|nr:hypothetical protein [Stenotrophomonas nitritireducens]MBN8791802.1 hypothetical protein [Stenotrophomonas nitritireducens]